MQLRSVFGWSLRIWAAPLGPWITPAVDSSAATMCRRSISSLPPAVRRLKLVRQPGGRVIDVVGWPGVFQERAREEVCVVHGQGQMPVPVKNSIRPPVTERERHGDTLADRVGAQPSSLTTGSRDDPRPRCLGLRPRRPRQLSRRLAGECRPPSSTGGAAAISRSTPAPPAGPALLGRALTPSLPLALSHRRAYDLVL